MTYVVYVSKYDRADNTKNKNNKVVNNRGINMYKLMSHFILLKAQFMKELRWENSDTYKSL